MHDKLKERCARERERSLSELESRVRGLFANPQILPGTYALGEVPVIGGLWIVDQPQIIPELLLRVVGALCAREKFRVDVPWAPPLPLRSEEIEAFKDADCHRLNLVGLFADSLDGEWWDYQLHPPFRDYVSGLMAYKHTPDRLRNDCELQREFPPRKLKGLCDGRLDWRNPKRIAQERHIQALGAAQVARLAAASPSPQC